MISPAKSARTNTTGQKKKESKQFFFNRRVYSIARKKEPQESSEHGANLLTLSSGSYAEEKQLRTSQLVGQAYPLEHLHHQRNSSLDKLSMVALPEQQRVNSQDYYNYYSQENENNSLNGIGRVSTKSTSAGRIRARSNNTRQQGSKNRRQSREFKKNSTSFQEEKYYQSQGKEEEDGEGVVNQETKQHLKQSAGLTVENKKENQDIEYYSSSVLAGGSLVHIQNLDTNNNNSSSINSTNNVNMMNSSSNCWILPNTICISAGNIQQTQESSFVMRTETLDTEQNLKYNTENSQMQAIMTDGNNQLDNKIVEEEVSQRLESQNQVNIMAQDRKDQNNNNNNISAENDNNQIQLKGGDLEYLNQVQDTQEEKYQQPMNKKRHQAYDVETAVHHKTITIDFNDEEREEVHLDDGDHNQQQPSMDIQTIMKPSSSFDQTPKSFSGITKLCESKEVTEQQPQESLQEHQQKEQQQAPQQFPQSQSVNIISSQHRSTSSNTKASNSGESNNCSGEVTSTTARTAGTRGQNFFEFSHLSGLKRKTKQMSHQSDDEKEQEEEDPETIDMNSLLQGPTVRYSLSNIDVYRANKRINKESQDMIGKENNPNMNASSAGTGGAPQLSQMDGNGSKQTTEPLSKPATFATTTSKTVGSLQTGQSQEIFKNLKGQSQQHSPRIQFNPAPPLLLHHTTSMPQLSVLRVQEFETCWKQLQYQHDQQQSSKKFSCIDFFLSILPQRLSKQQRDDKLLMLQLAEQPFDDQDSQHSALILSVHQSYRKILNPADQDKKYSQQKTTHTPKGNYTQREKEQSQQQQQLKIPQHTQKQQQQPLQIRGNHNVIVPEQQTTSNTICAAPQHTGILHLNTVKIHKIREEEQFSKCLKDFQIFSLVQILAFLETAKKSCSIGQTHRRLFRKINLILLLVRVSHVVSNKLKEGILDYAIASLGKHTITSNKIKGAVSEGMPVIGIVNSLFRAIFFRAVNSILQENLEINQINVKLYQNVEDIANALSNRCAVEEYLKAAGVGLDDNAGVVKGKLLKQIN